MSAVETFEAPKRPHIPFHGPERVQLEAWLDFYRATVLEKCDGLNAAQLRQRPVTSSSLSLLGIVRHMTFVEQIWFENRFAGRDTADYYKTEGDRDADFNDLDDTAVENVFILFGEAAQLSRELAAGHELDERVKTVARGRDVDLRWILIHMIEEYARHCGHADLIRELIDGSTGY
jgi:uncharacterized damage-inducible protein DinB